MNSESILIVNIRRHRTGGEVFYVCAKSNSGNDGNARHWASVDFVCPVRGYIKRAKTSKRLAQDVQSCTDILRSQLVNG